MVKGEITEYFVKHSTRDKTHKRCSRCCKWKLRNKFGNNNSLADKLAAECKRCHNTRNRRANISQERIRKTKMTSIEKKYEISERQYFGRLQETGYKCPMCLHKMRHVDDPDGAKSNVDHLVGTGVVYLKNKKTVHSGIPSVTRGLLCEHCNNTLARGKDDMATMIRGAQYLMTWGARHKYLSDTEISEYKKALDNASDQFEKGEEDWDPTYHT